MKIILIATLLALAACSNIPAAQQQAAVTAIVQTGVTLGTIAAANNTTAARLIAGGQLVCAVGPSFLAVAGVNVTGAPADAMSTICGAVNGVGAKLPDGVNPAAVPVATLTPAAKPPG